MELRVRPSAMKSITLVQAMKAFFRCSWGSDEALDALEMIQDLFGAEAAEAASIEFHRAWNAGCEALDKNADGFPTHWEQKKTPIRLRPLGRWKGRVVREFALRTAIWI